MTARDPHRDAFGRLLVSPEFIPREARINALREGAGRMLADRNTEVRWIGERLQAWLHQGGDFARILDIQPRPGSRATAASIIKREHVDTLLRKLSVAVGSDVRASAILRGRRPCPNAVRDLVEELRELRAPSSPRAFSRARKWTRRE